MSNVSEKVKEIIKEQLELSDEQLTNDAFFSKDLGADSIQITELIMQLEDAFEIAIEDEEIENIKTVGDAISYFEKKS
ncbi:MAG: acyl carrier protein [Chitinophagales bacterium]|nr:acyl carrier protein [Chitinophagales bacterium]